MNIDIKSDVIDRTNNSSSTQNKMQQGGNSFEDELSNLSETQRQKEDVVQEDVEQEDVVQEEKLLKEGENTSEDSAKDEIGSLQDAVAEMSDKVNQTDEKNGSGLKKSVLKTDKNKSNNEVNGLINNDMNVNNKEDLLNFQMNSDMNFNSDGKPFTEFIKAKNSQKLASTAKEKAEEEAILSTMEENLLLAKQKSSINPAELSKTKIVSDSSGIKKVDKKTNVVVDTIVKLDSIVMNENDVDFFVNLVEKGQAVSGANAKSLHVSKALADLILKSMNDNKPVRIDFDNNISVIIKISRDGKISADFLPSSQVAEAYLKENLPLLKQRFDDNNIQYDELNQRQQRQNNKEDQKKGRKDE